MLMKRDLAAILKQCVEVLILLSLEDVYSKELINAINELERAQQFLFTQKLLDLLNQLYFNLQRLKDAIKNSGADLRSSLKEIVKTIAKTAKDVATEFQLATNKIICLLTVMTISFMFASMTTLWYVITRGLLTSPQAVFLIFTVLFLTMATLITVYLRLLISLFLQLVIPILSTSHVVVLIITYNHAEVMLMTLIMINLAMSFFSLLFLIKQGSTYKKAMTIVIHMYNTLNSLKSYAERFLKRKEPEVNEDAFKKVYGYEYLELIKYVRDIMGIS
jgi:hypothetical protein